MINCPKCGSMQVINITTIEDAKNYRRVHKCFDCGYKGDDFIEKVNPTVFDTAPIGMIEQKTQLSQMEREIKNLICRIEGLEAKVFGLECGFNTLTRKRSV